MISIKGLTKKFNGFNALNGLDMNVKSGEVYGFIGQNGAGKTTTMNILAGLSKVDQGQCFVNGKDITRITHPYELDIGYLPEDPKFYPWMSARETLLYLSVEQKNQRVQEILRWTGLSDAADRRVGGFSRGMKQRLGLGVALIRNPKLFILDEPSSALDPEGRSEVLHMIKDLKKMGKTILFSTHILDDVERVCDMVGMIDNGKMVFEKPLVQLQKEFVQPLFDITPLHSVHSNTIKALLDVPGILSVTREKNSFTIKVENSKDSLFLMQFLLKHQIHVESFSLRKVRLEDFFLREVQEK